MRIVLALLLMAAFPSNSRTSWMTPESFHLSIGMPRGEVTRVLEPWHPKQGKDATELVVDYAGDKAITLEFRKDRLSSIRFELFAFLPEIPLALGEARDHLVDSRGKPTKSTKSILIWDNALPNVMVVATNDPASEQGKKGIGVLAVRYYDPR